MWESVALQIPIVAIFVWFVLEKSKRDAIAAEKRDSQWREFLAAQNIANAAALEKVASATQAVAEKLQEHHSIMAKAVTRMDVAAQIRQELLMDSKSKAKAARSPRNL
jgi:hypothetical protein